MKRSRIRPDGGGWLLGERRRDRLEVEPLEPRLLPSVAHATVAHPRAVVPATPPLPKFFNNPVYSISASIAPISDPGGNGHVFQPDIFVGGFAAPYSTVWLAEGPRGYFTNTTRADYTGRYAFEIKVPAGQTELRLFAENPLLQYSTVTKLQVTAGSPILAWDSLALRAIQNTATTGPEAARALAILHVAQYDAVAAIQAPRSAFGVRLPAPKGASPVAAADAAAKSVLDSLFPSQTGLFNDAMDQATFGLPKTTSIRDGLALGRQVGQATLADRVGDGSALTVDYTPSAVPGLWRPTPPSFTPATDPGYGQVKPFVLASGSQFRPPAPPTVGSAAYDQALAEVTALGRTDSTTRTAQQATAAQFWSDGAGSYTNPGHWNEIAEEVAQSRKGSLLADAHLFALLGVAMADAGIAAQDAKSTFDTWRPISAIQATDPTWTPLVVTPASPSYVSAHAAFGAAAADVLGSVFGPRFAFTDNLYAVTGLTRPFPSFAAAAAENAQSRIWAGDNFAFDIQQGQALGDQVGTYAIGHFPRLK